MKASIHELIRASKAEAQIALADQKRASTTKNYLYLVSVKVPETTPSIDKIHLLPKDDSQNQEKKKRKIKFGARRPVNIYKQLMTENKLQKIDNIVIPFTHNDLAGDREWDYFLSLRVFKITIDSLIHAIYGMEKN